MTINQSSDAAKPRRGRKAVPAIERFWPKVEKTPECWLWRAGINKWGYGVFGIRQENGKSVFVYAHRFSYELAKGKIPGGLVIDHMCHNPACVNPAHLRLATNKQNQENLSGPRVDNRLGIRGVSLTRSGKYGAKVGHNGEVIDVGTFDSLEEADLAVQAKRNELFTHNILDRKTA